ncbi:hypothetical protein RRF57_000086 [Xylaria bambusicola]|uniref:Uncharacterized protein n=1 Tax=Xylaria bambusicola TaxID=326684 RepID=A0AAN7U379_9PEZI
MRKNSSLHLFSAGSVLHPTRPKPALTRWSQSAQHPRIGNKLLVVARSHLRWKSGNIRVADSAIDLSDLSETYRPRTDALSLDLALELRRIEVLAFQDNGSNALDILKALDESDGDIMVLKGMRCLQAYRKRIRPLSLEEARKVIDIDDAGKIVQDWFFQPRVRAAIETNYGENKIFLSLVAYILVGAGKATTLRTWMKQQRKGLKTTSLNNKMIYEKYKWKDTAMAMLVTALITWHPRGLADAGYDYFSMEYEEYWPKMGGPMEFYQGITRSPWAQTVTHIDQNYLSKSYPASVHSFERCASHVIDYHNRTDPFYEPMITAALQTVHPTRPSADLYVSLLREICEDQEHPFRFFCRGQSGTRKDFARYHYAVGERASRLLKSQGRYTDASFVVSTVYKIWGDSDFLSPYAIQRYNELFNKEGR